MPKRTHEELMTTSQKHYVKILNRELNHHGFQYHIGPEPNVDTHPFQATDNCEAGGLYFTTMENAHKFISYGTLLVDVEIPKGAKVYELFYGKLKADQIILTNPRPIPLNVYMKAVCDGFFSEHVLKHVRCVGQPSCICPVESVEDWSE